MIGGTLIVHNAVQFDYCVEASLESLARICDEVFVGISAESNDGTWEMLGDLKQRKFSHVRLVPIPWKPCSMGTWLSDLTNLLRVFISRPSHLCLQCDEVLHEDDYPLVREYASRGGTYALNRLNFWMDAQHMLQPETKVGSRIVRLAPVSLPSVGDAQSLDPSKGFEITPIKIFHYGFLRNAGAFAAKSREMQQAFFNTVDPIIDAVEKEGSKALLDTKYPTAVPAEQLLPYRGTHPKAAHKWLTEHGYQV